MTLDAINQKILDERQKAREIYLRQQVGDLVEMDGKFSRIARIDDSGDFQTLHTWHDTLEEAANTRDFYLTRFGKLEFVGTYGKRIEEAKLETPTGKIGALCWFFRNNNITQHNRIETFVRVNFWQIKAENADRAQL